MALPKLLSLTSSSNVTTRPIKQVYWHSLLHLFGNEKEKLLFFLHFAHLFVTLPTDMSEPLAERMRPRTLDDYVGQRHLVGEGAVLRKMIDAGRISSFILWGPPGVGKTTLAQIIANKLETPFYTLSAVTSGVKDVRDVIERARSNRFFSSASPILFIDEIHRFSKSQQDSLLGAVERGVVTLIGATTENPSFEVIRPLLSRCQLYVLKSLEKDDLLALVNRALKEDVVLRERKITLKESGALLRYSGGDARKLLNILELVVEVADGGTDTEVVITDQLVEDRLQQNPLAYDKDGEMHYDIISAFIKSIRGSDPDAALYWMARMIEGASEKIITTEVLGKSGEPIVLSGLIQNEESWTERRTPGLSKIPVLGWLFKSKKQTAEKTEMVIYLVPHWENDESGETQKIDEEGFRARIIESVVLGENYDGKK